MNKDGYIRITGDLCLKDLYTDLKFKQPQEIAIELKKVMEEAYNSHTAQLNGDAGTSYQTLVQRYMSEDTTDKERVLISEICQIFCDRPFTFLLIEAAAKVSPFVGKQGSGKETMMRACATLCGDIDT